MTNPIYSPRTGSIPFKVLQFLKANPDEELTRQDIALKFDTAVATVDQLLAIAKARGALKTARNSAMQLVWMLDDVSAFEIGEAEEPLDADTTPAGVVGLGIAPPTPPSAVRAPVAPVDDAAMPFNAPIVKGGAQSLLPDSEARRRKNIEAYNKWFSGFDVGDAAKFGAKHMRDVSGLTGKYSKAHGVAFRCRKINDREAAIVREA